jgi:hypothetical protein
MENGIDLFGGARELDFRGNGVKVIREFIQKYGTLYTGPSPGPGDLVFFSNTYDKNRDRKVNDPLTHVGIVERVDSDGTITFFHLIRNRIRRDAMNLSKPSVHKDENDKVINDYLRRRRRYDHSGTPYLTAQLFAGFGTIVQTAAVTPSLTDMASSSTTPAP